MTWWFHKEIHRAGKLKTRTRRALVVSFSGIDGAGKSTQISALQDRMTEAGIRVLLLTFWDDVAVWTRLREAASHGLFEGDKGIGTPDRPLNRRDKNVRAWHVTAARFFFYLLDSLHLNLVVAKALASGAEVVIFDRYIYDEFANLFPKHWLIGAYVRLMLKCVPRPDVAFLLDTDPLLARARKPEYPVDFLCSNRASYLDLSELAGMTVISASTLLEIERKITEEMLKRWKDLAHFAEESHQVDSSS